MKRLILFAGFAALGGCAVAKVAGAAVSVGAAAAKTTVKAGGAVIDGAVDAVDDDSEERRDGEAVPGDQTPARDDQP